MVLYVFVFVCVWMDVSLNIITQNALWKCKFRTKENTAEQKHLISCAICSEKEHCMLTVGKMSNQFQIRPCTLLFRGKRRIE